MKTKNQSKRLHKRHSLPFRLLSLLLFVCLLTVGIGAGTIESGDTPSNDESTSVSTMPFELDCKSAVLMEATTGTVLCAFNETEALPPASVTKVMTLLLCMEEIASGKLKLDDTVTASAHATSMGGSQIYLKEGEQMSVEDMLKSVVIASANDAAVALAEHIAGSEEAFVKRMNERAEALGMKSTHFENTNGLDDTTQNHLTSALDIAIMSREICKYPKIFEYSSIWMDTIRNGAFGLTNTNRLIRFYKGATGLKTGSTSKAGFCISATAERDGMTLIAVIMGAPNRDVRNESAKKLFDYGFANYALYSSPTFDHAPLRITGGVRNECTLSADPFNALVSKANASRVEAFINLPESISAPVRAGDVVGSISYVLDGKELGSVKITASQSVEKIAFSEVLRRLLIRFLVIGEAKNYMS